MRPRHQPALSGARSCPRWPSSTSSCTARGETPRFMRTVIRPTSPVPNVTYLVPHLHRLPALLAPPRQTRDVTPLGGAGTRVTHIVW